jgi:hypothetical protein
MDLHAGIGRQLLHRLLRAEEGLHGRDIAAAYLLRELRRHQCIPPFQLMVPVAQAPAANH